MVWELEIAGKVGIFLSHILKFTYNFLYALYMSCAADVKNIFTRINAICLDRYRLHLILKCTCKMVNSTIYKGREFDPQSFERDLKPGPCIRP